MRSPIPSVVRRIDGAFGWLAIVAAALLAVVLATQAFARGWSQSWFVVLVYLVIAYLVLPRLHTALAAVYLPDYFIGRTRTREGILGDPVNIALMGSEEQIHTVMRDAGWVLADDLGFRANLRIVVATLTRRSYPNAPVSNLYLFGGRQAFCYQQEVGNSPGKRHHVRFWRTPDDWLLPGGRRVEWLAAATFDSGVGFSVFTWQVTHRVAQDIDAERDHVIGSLGPVVRVDVIEAFSAGYHSRNGGGDAIQTDGDLPVADLGAVVADEPALQETSRRVGRVRPGEVVAGVLLMAIRPLAAAALVLALVTGVDIAGLLGSTADTASLATPGVRVVLAVVFGIVSLFWWVLTLRVWLGRPFARFTTMTLSTIGIVTVAAAWIGGTESLTMQSGLAGFALDIAILFALSGAESRQWTLGRKRRRRRSPGGVVSPRA